jgi:hemerythrin-like metal-binding protein
MQNLNFLKIWHRTFALHIEYVIEGVEETTFLPSEVGDATNCQFGKWAISATQELSNNSKFEELLAVHAQFHRVAGQLLRLHVDGKHLAAQALIGDLNYSSESIAARVDELEESLYLSHADFDPNAGRFKSQVAESSWDDSLLVGIPVLDEQHKGIAKLADEFLASPTHRLSSERGREILNNIHSLVSLHFDTEELYMARSDMSEDGINAHKADHDEILNSLVSLTYDLALSKVSMSFGEVFSLLQKLFFDHVIDFDMNLSKGQLRSLS